MISSNESLNPHEKAVRTRKQRTYARILGAATDLFRESVYGEVSFERIAKRGSISPTTVYSTFDSKGQLALDVFDGELSDAVLQPSNHRLLTPRECTTAFVDTAKTLRGITQAVLDERIRLGETEGALMPGFHQGLKGSLERGQDLGTIRQALNAEQASSFIIGGLALACAAHLGNDERLAEEVEFLNQLTEV